MCFDDGDDDDDDNRSTYQAKVETRNSHRCHHHQALLHRGMSLRRRYGFGGSYYPGRYYSSPPTGPRLEPAVRSNTRSQQRGYPSGVVAGGFQRGVAPGLPLQSQAMMPATHGRGSHWPASGYQAEYYAATGGRAAMPTHSAMRNYYNAMPSYGYATAHVYPPGPHATATTYHVTNAQAPPFQAAPQVVRETRPAFGHHGHPHEGFTRDEIQMENRRVATARGAYDPRKIRPADARDDDPFWCRELNGEWHLRSYYQIEMECQPGRWMMDADVGFLVFHRG